MSSVAKKCHSLTSRSAVIGLLVFFAGATMDHVLSYAGDSRTAWLLDHLGVGVLVACLLAFYDYRNRRMVLLMNHHVRNALQVIVYALYASGRGDRPAMEAVARIEWALRDVLTCRTGDAAGNSVPTFDGECSSSAKAKGQ